MHQNEPTVWAFLKQGKRVFFRKKLTILAPSSRFIEVPHSSSSAISAIRYFSIVFELCPSLDFWKQSNKYISVLNLSWVKYTSSWRLAKLRNILCKKLSWMQTSAQARIYPFRHLGQKIFCRLIAKKFLKANKKSFSNENRSRSIRRTLDWLL